jgi:hypothetical protein
MHNFTVNIFKIFYNNLLDSRWKLLDFTYYLLLSAFPVTHFHRRHKVAKKTNMVTDSEQQKSNWIQPSTYLRSDPSIFTADAFGNRVKY